MDINKCVELYKLMAQRCDSFGFENNQSEIYSEMADFIATCSSVEESMNKIKNSKYYLAPSIALVKDKLSAWKAAAIENGMPEIVEVVDFKLKKIENDNSEIYVTGHEQTIQKYKNKYILTMQAFGNVFNGYIGYIATGEDYNLNDIKKQLEIIEYPTSDFSQIANMKQFRSLIPVNQSGYEIFVKDIINYINTGDLKCSFVGQDSFNLDKEVEVAWNNALSVKKDITNAGRDSKNPSLYRHHLPEMKAVAPVINIDYLENYSENPAINQNNSEINKENQENRLRNPKIVDGLFYTYVDLNADNQPQDDSSNKSNSNKKHGLFSRLRGE